MGQSLTPGPGAFLPPTREEPLAKEESLEKEQKEEGKGKGKGLEKSKVLVDWLGTLAHRDGAPPANKDALEKLLGKAEVYLLSWVGSQKRKLSTLHDMEQDLGKY